MSQKFTQRGSPPEDRQGVRAFDLLEELLPAPSQIPFPALEIDTIWDPLLDHRRFQALPEQYPKYVDD